MQRIGGRIAKALIACVPVGVRRSLRRALTRLRGLDRRFDGLSTREVFEKIHAERLWGEGPDGRASSGSGTRDTVAVDSYVAAVARHLADLPPDLTFVDLGCGDFTVGQQLAPLCGRLIACDIVAATIEENRALFPLPGVTFRVLDLVTDPLPEGDVILVRQVLQHLRNDDVAAFVRKMEAHPTCRRLIVTEHLSARPDFRPNRDKLSGAGIRVSLGSGLDLAAPPFSLRHLGAEILNETNAPSGVEPALIRTTAYRLRDN
jgi:hypothetical protein